MTEPKFHRGAVVSVRSFVEPTIWGGPALRAFRTARFDPRTEVPRFLFEAAANQARQRKKGPINRFGRKS